MAVKRKAAGSDSGDEDAPEGGEFPSPVDMLPSPVDLATLRERIKSDLLTFQEAAVLDASQLDDAVDRVIRESNPSTATPTAQGMVRFDDECIRETFHCAKWFVTSTAEDHPPAGVVLPGWLEERQRMLDEEMKPEKRVDPDNSRFLLAKVRIDLLTKGFVELPKPYLDYTFPPPHTPQLWIYTPVKL
ncbi:hypothetical protein VPH35_064013 [Triticum aestivum]